MDEMHRAAGEDGDDRAAACLEAAMTVRRSAIDCMIDLSIV